MKPIRILLVDDHPNVRTQIRARLSREPDFEIVGEADSSAQALALALALTPNVILIDPIMRDRHGLAVVTQIARQSPQIVIAVLTAFADTALQMELKRMRVSLILDKGIQSERLIALIRRAEQTARINPIPSGGT